MQYWKSRDKPHTENGNYLLNRNKRLTPKEELFLTLMRLRRGFSLQTLSYLYDVPTPTLSKMFTTWIQFIYLEFNEIKSLMFPSANDLKSTLPPVFKGFNNIRCSIDCTEFHCQSPRNYSRQGNLYSQYKSHTTFKALIAVTPHGSACFISDLFEGSISDRDIFCRSGIIDFINPGDVLLVDKGFKIEDVLAPFMASTEIPPFLGKREHFTKEEIMKTRKIARARIHVERFNERLKKNSPP